MSETRIVDNRVFLLGLDDLFREAMKSHERTELLDAAEATASTLGVTAAEVPIEGYYTEDDELTRYFRIMRALQAVPQYRESELIAHNGFSRLKQVTASRIFGEPAGQGFILPTASDCLTVALSQTFPNWSIEAVTERAYGIAIGGNDISLVALAALSRDPVVLASLRESVVLYAMALGGSAMFKEPMYIWQVDKQIANRAAEFVHEFNSLMGADLPAPIAENARMFWVAFREWKVWGRCVRIGFDDRVAPTRHYHWAVDHDGNHNLVAKEFWDTEIWTTSRYREAHKVRL